MMTGLACVTPGAGVVQSWAAIVIGILSGSIPWFTMMILHKKSTLLQKAIERRRARLADTEHHRLASPTPEELGVPVPDLSTVDAQLEHGSSLTTPSPAIMAKKFCPKRIQNLPKTRLDNLIGEEAGFITPQKRLLNSIHQVNEKVMLEELHRIKRTPSAKKAEREKKVHTLMSMR